MSDPSTPLEELSAVPTLATKIVDDLEQLRALSDPLRLRILEALCGPPRTTKQVADQLGEKPTRLYHHVDALESAGLVRLVLTRPKRGTLEKYYQSVARQFRADSSLFPRAEASDRDSWPFLGARLLDDAATKLRRLGEVADSAQDGPTEAPMAHAMIAHVKLRTTPGALAQVRERLESVIADLSEFEDAEADDAESFELTLALIPGDA